jgi:hypothetical protein
MISIDMAMRYSKLEKEQKEKLEKQLDNLDLKYLRAFREGDTKLMKKINDKANILTANIKPIKDTIVKR